MNVNGVSRYVLYPLEVLTLTKINLRSKIFSTSRSRYKQGSGILQAGAARRQGRAEKVHPQ